MDSHGRSHQQRVATLIEVSGVVLFEAFKVKVPGVVYIVRLQKMLRKKTRQKRPAGGLTSRIAVSQPLGADRCRIT